MKCPVCDEGKLVGRKTKYSYGDIELGEYDSLVCSKCNDVFFTEESSRAIEQRAKELGVWGLEKRGKISYSGNSLVVRIPKAIAEFMSLKEGKEVQIRPEGKKKLVISVE